MATIKFKAKVQTMYHVDDTIAYTYITVPKFTKAHCDMQVMRIHAKYGAYANSDLFPRILARLRKEKFPSGMINLDQALPAGVTIDQSGFLAVITFEV